ncbi:hypothetical protein ACJX0J_008532, partial [Zea mays]
VDDLDNKIPDTHIRKGGINLNFGKNILAIINGSSLMKFGSVPVSVSPQKWASESNKGGPERFMYIFVLAQITCSKQQLYT